MGDGAMGEGATSGAARMGRQTLMEHESEEIPGLPGPLPAGESMLWQGSPDWWSLARSMHVRELAVYFAAITAIRGFTAWHGDVAADATIMAELLAVAAAALGLILLFAVLSARTTIYTITERRVVLRYGVALSKAVNIPFSMVTNAGLRRFADGTGDVSLKLERAERVPYVMMWPHVRPWRFWPSQPTLRSIPEAARVAQTLGRALAAATGGQVEAIAAAPVAGEPGREHGLASGGAVAA
jgi:hypothetical protein